jgi:hypothetical protein
MDVLDSFDYPGLCSGHVRPPRLIPAIRDELRQAFAYALRCDERGRPHREAVDDMTRRAAQTLVRQLELSGLVVMKRPPVQPHGMPADG